MRPLHITATAASVLLLCQAGAIAQTENARYTAGFDAFDQRNAIHDAEREHAWFAARAGARHAAKGRLYRRPRHAEFLHGSRQG